MTQQPGPSVRRGRGRPRDPAVDQRITAAAAELMLLRGFDNTTVDDVAAKAGVGKATV
ncbi:MAG: helix-turn-helix domain-containing protein [Nocardioidaceae bacterium]